MKLLIDMNLSPRWIGTLASAGLEADHWSRLGRASATDVEIMAFAASHDFVVLTHDLDFGSILAVTRGRKPSVVQLRSDDTSPEAVGVFSVAAIWHCAAELEAGALLTIHASRHRLSLLPLR